MKLSNRAALTASAVAVGIGVCATTPVAMAEEACPLLMPKDSITTFQVPVGWKARVGPSVRLTSAGMLHGPFDGSGYLKPATTELKKTARGIVNTSTWEFGPPPHYPKWLVCEYGSAVELFKPIAEDITACTLVTSTKGPHVREIALTCKR